MTTSQRALDGIRGLIGLAMTIALIVAFTMVYDDLHRTRSTALMVYLWTHTLVALVLTWALMIELPVLRRRVVRRG